MSFEKEDKPVVVDYDSMRTIERPAVLDCDVVRFQNNRERWIAFVGLLDGRPYEIFTGLNDEDDGIMLPKSVTSGKIIKSRGADGKSRYDFQFTNKRGFKTTVEGLSQKFDHEYWNYAKLISGVLRYGMPIEQVIKLVAGLQLNNESINTWKIGVERALRKYSNGEGSYLEQVCPNCGNYTLEKLNARVVCRTCGYYRNL
jgi:ribonucleoside-diphosphate reductase alpha chain